MIPCSCIAWFVTVIRKLLKSIDQAISNKDEKTEPDESIDQSTYPSKSSHHETVDCIEHQEHQEYRHKVIFNQRKLCEERV
jgi:hypothetical protein